jgi:hypothetical protein
MNSGDFEEAETILTAGIEMQPDVQSSSSTNIQALLQLISIRKEAKNALKRSVEQTSLVRPKTIQLKLSNLDGVTATIRVSTGQSSLHAELNVPMTLDSSASNSTINTASSPVRDAATNLQPSPSNSRSRPAYASTSKSPNTVSLDQNIVMAWADYIQTHGIPRSAPSIPLSLTIGIPVQPGFETHYKIAAFALTESRSKPAK